MSDAPVDNAAREARIAELAVGFGLGELTDEELREFYDCLREPGDRGLRAARVAWQQLGVVTDLRAELGSTFLAEVRHRLGREGLSDRFVRSARQRLGLPTAALPDVTAAPLAPSRSGRRLLVVVVLVIALALLIPAWWKWHAGGLDQVCEVETVTGSATIGGDPLLPGMILDASGKTVVVPEGSAVALAGVHGRQLHLVCAGPATLICHRQAFSLPSGELWLQRGDAPVLLGLPDESLTFAPGTVVAVQVVDGASTVGCSQGRVFGSTVSITSGECLAHRAAFPWESGELAALTTPTTAVPVWSATLTPRWTSTDAQVVVRIGDAGFTQGWELSWRPGQILERVLPGMAGPGEVMAIPGPPLALAPLTLRAIGQQLLVSCAGTTLPPLRIPSPSSLALPAPAADLLAHARWQTGPSPQPPLPMPDPHALAR